MGNQSQRLTVMVKPAIRRHDFLQALLASMTKRRMTKIMRQGKRLGQIFVNLQDP